MATFPTLQNPFSSNNFGLPSITTLKNNASNKSSSTTRYYNAQGEELNYPPWTGTAYSADGNIVYTFKNGKVSVSSKKGLPSSTKINTKINTTVIKNGVERNVYRRTDGTFYYNDGNKTVDIKDFSTVTKLNQNKNVCIDLDETTNTSNKNTTTNNTSTKKPASSGGGTTYSAPKVDTSAYDKKIADLEKKIYELEHPKVYSAQELADIYGIDYNEQNILNDYNKSTNEYYDDAVKAQNDLRTQYAKNNARYVDQIADSYIDSYANAAPTAVGKGTLAANALSTQLNAGQINSSNDYGMMQSVNTLNEARKAELKNNPQAAKEYYNSIGTYLSGLSANKNASDVKQYVDQLDAYSQMYAADRSYQSLLAQANAAKYAGLANAAASNASAAANSNKFQDIYDFYLVANGGNKQATDSYISNMLLSSAKK